MWINITSPDLQFYNPCILSHQEQTQCYGPLLHRVDGEGEQQQTGIALMPVQPSIGSIVQIEKVTRSRSRALPKSSQAPTISALQDIERVMHLPPSCKGPTASEFIGWPIISQGTCIYAPGQ